jgi:hypothetical protein
MMINTIHMNIDRNILIILMLMYLNMCVFMCLFVYFQECF